MRCWVFFKPILQQWFANAVISPWWIWFQCTAPTHVIQKCVCSHVQPRWWNGMIVSCWLSCALVLWITVSFHLFKDWLIISVVDMVCSQSLQNIVSLLKLWYNYLCLAFRKHSGSFSLNIFSGLSVFDISWSFLLMHLCVTQNWEP